MVLRLPGMIDPHVHMRDPGATHKEDWESGTVAALAGGFTAVLAMPNTNPAITDQRTLTASLKTASSKARCDYTQYLGAGADNIKVLSKLASRAAGIKMYLDQTYGSLRLDNMLLWMNHLQNLPRSTPLVVHAEGCTLAAAILIASLYARSIHLAHVSRREEILLIRKAKEKGLQVTCEVTPHHLLLSEVDIPMLGQGRSEVRPTLATKADLQSLWENISVIDCFASDHAPHTLQEKDSPQPPPGFPGLETSLPLMLTALAEERFSLDFLIERMYTNPRRIFQLPEQRETWIEIDPSTSWEIRGEDLFTRCKWTPFEGFKVQGRLRRVVLRGKDCYRDGKVYALPGYGKHLRDPDYA